MALMTIVLKDVGSKFDLFFFGLRSGTEALNSAKLPFKGGSDVLGWLAGFGFKRDVGICGFSINRGRDFAVV